MAVGAVRAEATPRPAQTILKGEGLKAWSLQYELYGDAWLAPTLEYERASSATCWAHLPKTSKWPRGRVAVLPLIPCSLHWATAVFAYAFAFAFALLYRGYCYVAVVGSPAVDRRT